MMDYGEYGRALFLAAEEAGRIEEIALDIKAAGAAVEENPDYVKLLDTPAVSKAEKHALIDGAFSSLDEYCVNFLKLLSDKCIFFSLGEAVKAFCLLYDEHHNIERVEAVTARPMTAEQLAAMKEKIDKMTLKCAVITNTVDPSVLGGVAIRYSGVQLDGTVKRRLDDLAKSLEKTVI
jgi:F-type H+-transporting ATPase subunit delta